MSGRTVRNKLLFYDAIADVFDELMNPYDLKRRLDIVFGLFLSKEELKGRSLLDVGCGTGWFSRRAAEMGSSVVSLDIGFRLLKKAREKYAKVLVVADACVLCFPNASFDIIVSSECIEHTLDPKQALREMHRVLKPGGILLITVPNWIWKISVTVANLLKLRPYEGFENWLGWRELRRELTSMNFQVTSMLGFHLFPPVVRWTWPFLQFMDRFGGCIGPVMLNIAVKAQK